MSIVPIQPIEVRPEITLINWAIVESGIGKLFFVGYCFEVGSHTFSTQIQYFDPVTRKGITLSGRIYKLVGNFCLDFGGLEMVDIFKKRNEIDYKDVTEKMMYSKFSKIN